jgi:epoxide hydrolase-like predicted phosphatase
MTIQTIIWDFGGVLVRTEDHTPREQLAARVGMTSDELYRLIYNSQSSRQATLGEISTQEHWNSVLKALNLPKEEYPRVPREFWGGDSLDENLMEYIRDSRSHHTTALLSNAWDDLRQALIEEWKIIDAFDHVIISAEVGLAKPDPRIFQLTLARVGAEPEEAVFIDDFIENIQAARGVGLHAIHFQNPHQALGELELLLDHPTGSHQ